MQGVKILEMCIHVLDTVKGVTMGKEVGVTEYLWDARESVAIAVLKKIRKGKLIE